MTTRRRLETRYGTQARCTTIWPRTVNLAVPIGVTSFDENTVRCKGRAWYRSYIKTNSIEFGIRFYVDVE